MGDPTEKWLPLIKQRLRFCVDHPDYEDALQEARVAVWQALEENRRRLAPFAESSIVFRQARWAALDYLRGKRAAPGFHREGSLTSPTPLSLDEIATSLQEQDRRDLDEWSKIEALPDFAPEWLRQEEYREHWWRCLSAATEPQQQVLRLRYYFGCTYAEVARLTGMSASWVEKTIFVALQRYRSELGIARKDRRQ